ncbi:hypothetical protein TNCV_4286311 [Trichonephila clavipes]|nr:hypothetical protein TNCV_4286311 [Trichonephila clavipes]
MIGHPIVLVTLRISFTGVSAIAASPVIKFKIVFICCGRGAREVGGSLFIRCVHKYRYSSVRVLARLVAAEKFLAASALRRSRNRLARSAPDIGVPVCGALPVFPTMP